MKNQKTKKTFAAFTLIELLAVIAIIATLAGLILGGMGAAKKKQYITTATAELKTIEDAIEQYKIQYGSYPPGNDLGNPLINPLFYELSGVSQNGGVYTTLDGTYSITVATFSGKFGAGGPALKLVQNASHGGGEDAKAAKNFLLNLNSKMVGSTILNPQNTDPQLLITSIGGPDQNWQPIGPSNPGNPFQYVVPGTNNPSSYDLWVELHINGKTNIIGNWTAK